MPITTRVTLDLPRSDWAALRLEADRRKTTMAALLRGWIEPKLRRLRPGRIGLDGTPEPVHPDQALD
jgi:hypothetical protein